MKVLSILGGVALLLSGVGGAVSWVTGFDVIKGMLVDGVPLFIEHGGTQTQFPGRLVGAAVLIFPIVCAIGGAWILRSQFEREDERDT